MSLFDEADIEYPFKVTVKRPKGEFSEAGNYEESFETIITEMTADIQLSLKVRNLVSEDKTGAGDKMVWIMFCKPATSIRAGDSVFDGTRSFMIDAVSEWGSHTECVMRMV